MESFNESGCLASEVGCNKNHLKYMHCFLKYNFVWSDNILKVLQREQIFKYIT